MASTPTEKIVKYNKANKSYSIIKKIAEKQTLNSGGFFTKTAAADAAGAVDTWNISDDYGKFNDESGFTLLKGCKIIINKKVYSIYEKDNKLAYGISDTFYITITKSGKDYTTIIN